MKVTIKRSEWGEGYLTSPGGSRMCALGFLGKECGVPRENMIACTTPSDVDSKYNKEWAKSGIVECIDGVKKWDEGFISDVIKVNDRVDKGTREIYLKNIFSKKGLDLVFED